MKRAIAMALVLLAAGCDAILGLADPTILGAPDAGMESGVHADAAHDSKAGRADHVSPGFDAAPDAGRDTGVDAHLDALRAKEATAEASSDAEAGVDALGCSIGAGAATSCLAAGAGLTNCGAAADDCCCASLEVDGGTYDRNYANSAAAADAGYLATVHGFRLDKYEVTVGRFRQYVQFLSGIGGTPPANGSGKHTHLNGGQGLLLVGQPPDSGMVYETGWDGTDWNQYVPSGNGTASTWNTDLTTACTNGQYATWTSSPGANENLPINCLGWYAAYAFCIWDGGFLPSEAEWEFAAAGGAEMRNFAWGSESPGLASAYAVYGCNYPDGGGTCAEAGTANLAKVGLTAKGVGRYGQLDLGGNVWEYALDTFDTYVVPCVDCVNESSGTFRIERGGSFADTASTLVAPFRGYGYSTAFDENGIRCARSP
jgi:formylglycine-generating enzyme